MASLRHRLMLEEGQRRFRDAQRLGQSNLEDPFSDSAHLLSLLGFELLLKLVFELTTRNPAPQHHKYNEMFNALPTETRSEAVTFARTRVGPTAFAIPIEDILKDWSTNFVSVRYPYERYSKMTEQQYAERSKSWAESGGPLDEADVRYYPEELFGMVEALLHLAKRLNRN